MSRSKSHKQAHARDTLDPVLSYLVEVLREQLDESERALFRAPAAPQTPTLSAFTPTSKPSRAFWAV